MPAVLVNSLTPTSRETLHQNHQESNSQIPEPQKLCKITNERCFMLLSGGNLLCSSTFTQASNLKSGSFDSQKSLVIPPVQSDLPTFLHKLTPCVLVSLQDHDC